MKAKRPSKVTTRLNEHAADHSVPSSHCCLCRIKSLELAATTGEPFSALALYHAALEATQALERLHKMRVTEVCKLVEGAVAWPVLVWVNDKESQRVPAELGVRHPSIPLSWKKLLTLHKLPHWIICRLFTIIRLLRALHGEKVIRDARRAVGKLPRKVNVAALTELFERSVDPDDLANALAERLIDAKTPPELASHAENPTDELIAELERLTSALDIDAIKDTSAFIKKHTHEALGLPDAGATAMDAWFELAWSILVGITNGKPAVPRLHIALAPRRELRKTNRDGTTSKALGDVSTRIRERLEVPLKTLKPGLRERKNAKRHDA